MPGDSNIVNPGSSKSLKRSRSNEEPTTLASKRVYTIFASASNQIASGSSSSASAAVAQSTSLEPFQWLKPSLGPKKTCLHGINLVPPFRPQIAAFDLDGTVIESAHRKKAGTEWKWWNKVVPGKLKELHDEGYSIVLISNQNLNAGNLMHWKKKIPLIAGALPDVPFRIFAATGKDAYRKPMPGMWFELEKMSRESGVELDKSKSFYVGDAAGRSGDFAGTDRKWAINVDLSFHTPEEYFLGLKPVSFKLQGFSASGLSQNLPHVTPSSSPIVPADPMKPEVVVFVGMPSSGKSSFFSKHFNLAGYAHINQDTIGSRAKCVKAVEEAVKAGTSCVIDNTNRDVKTRKYYLDLAQRLGAHARCFVFDVSIDLAWHNNLYRAFCKPFLPNYDTSNNVLSLDQVKRDIVPYLAFSSFRDAYEEPTLEEGFREIKKVNWVFEGSDEERRMWEMWLQIDGK